MALLFRYFAFIAAAICVFNWTAGARRLAVALDDASVDRAIATRVLRLFWGGQLALFLLVAILQFLGGYSDPLFPLYEGLRTSASRVVWLGVFALWIALALGIWRPGVAKAAVALGLFRGPAVSPQTFRLIATGLLLVNAAVFGALLLGVWGPIPKPTF